MLVVEKNCLGMVAVGLPLIDGMGNGCVSERFGLLEGGVGAIFWSAAKCNKYERVRRVARKT